jgi:hypothetical protein
MSRYLLLLLFTLPFILAGVLSAFTQYKLKKSSGKRAVMLIIFWVIVLAGLASASFIYDELTRRGFTQTDSLSLFDVVEITAIVFLLYVCNRMRQKISVMEDRLQDLHQEISIQVSEIKSNKR